MRVTNLSPIRLLHWPQIFVDWPKAQKQVYKQKTKTLSFSPLLFLLYCAAPGWCQEFQSSFFSYTSTSKISGIQKKLFIGLWLKFKYKLLDCFCILHDFVKGYKIGNRDNNTYKTWSRRTIKKKLLWHSPTLLGLAPFFHCFFFFVPIPFYFLFFLLQIFYFSTSVCEFVSRVCIAFWFFFGTLCGLCPSTFTSSFLIFNECQLLATILNTNIALSSCKNFQFAMTILS